jgi:allophanate hydrolase
VGGPPFHPTLVQSAQGARIPLEIWSLPVQHVGTLLAGVQSPLAIGTIELEDWKKVKSFLCEQAGLEGARDITGLGGWQNFIAQNTK